MISREAYLEKSTDEVKEDLSLKDLSVQPQYLEAIREDLSRRFRMEISEDHVTMEKTVKEIIDYLMKNKPEGS